jgi:hypothetical protein
MTREHTKSTVPDSLSDQCCDEDVLRLDVAVDQTLRVRSIERCSDLADDSDRALRLKRATFEQFMKILAAHQPHIDVEVSVDLTPVVDRDDVRFLEHRRSAGLSLKPSAKPLVTGKLRGQDFQRDRAVLSGVVSLIHLTHTALPE